ncbi:MAG TPA: cbb3-type cytochrome c oxidase subunit I [Spirillospora sp.]|nr:cbb3-type cytochrome c oxidase subunit I [Spirillospora sp.]
MEAAQPTSGRETTFIKFPALSMLESERSLIGIHILVALAALSIGLLMGPFQTFRRSPFVTETLGGGQGIAMPIFSYYYQALTVHGVLNALVFTTFFIVGFSHFVTQRSLQRPLASMSAAWAAFVLMFVGLLLAAFAIITNQANVLFTFYAPLLAHWTFYLGLALVIIGSWVAAAVTFMTYMAWRKDNPGKTVPLAVFAIVANYIMWITASLGVAIEVVTMLLPLSLGIIATTDPQVARILFWFFGHPLVYFWLIPAYVSWYTMLPKQLGVPLFSDSVGRAAFLMLMIFSIPVGVHHLFVDPGISELAKISHSLMTFIVTVPSLLTAFNIGATLERAGRQRGGNMISWVWKQPWSNPLVAAQLCGMLLFIVGGITGIMNASFTLNVALHNTTWVVGHFHMTLAGAVTLTYFGIAYWLVPLIRGRRLFSSKLALAQIYTWFAGMLLFGAGMGRAGIDGATRRTDLGAPGVYISDLWVPWLDLTALGGLVLLISSVLLYVVLVGTWFRSTEPVETEAPIATEGPASSPPALFERWGTWIAIIILSNVIMWGPVLLQGLDFVNGFLVPGQPGAAR